MGFGREQVEYRDGRWNGRTLREWLPFVVGEIVHSVGPQRVILFGSLARGDEGPESDADLLVVLDRLDRTHRPETMAAVRRSVTAPIPLDILVTDAEEIAERGDLNGSSLYWPLREGKTLYERAAA
jgi:predicted nucleotidyltransferase